MFGAPPSSAPPRTGRSEPTTSKTVVRSATRVSRLGGSTLQLEAPVPRRSCKIRRENDARPRNHSADGRTPRCVDVAQPIELPDDVDRAVAHGLIRDVGAVVGPRVLGFRGFHVRPRSGGPQASATLAASTTQEHVEVLHFVSLVRSGRQAQVVARTVAQSSAHQGSLCFTALERKMSSRRLAIFGDRALVLVLEVAEDVAPASSAGRSAPPSSRAPHRRTRSCAGGGSRLAPRRGPRAAGSLSSVSATHQRDTVGRATARAPPTTSRVGTPSRTMARPAREVADEALDQLAVVLQRRRALEQHAPEAIAERLAALDERRGVVVGVLQLLAVGDPLVCLQREHEPFGAPARASSATVFSRGTDGTCS